MEVVMIRFVFIMGTLAVLSARAQAAQVDYFLKLEGIQGESESHSHGERIEVMDFSYAIHQPTFSEGGGAGSGKVTHEPITITSSFSREFLSLFERLFTCKECKVNRLVLRSFEVNGDVKRVIQTLVLDNPKILRIDGGNPDSPSESQTITFGAIRIRYIEQRSNPASKSKGD
jgi:type VI secretion system secreted protein Hcp